MSDFPPPPPPPPIAPPPGYVAYGAPGAVSPFQNIAGLTKWLRVLVIVGIVASVVTLLLQIALRSRADDFVNGVIDRDRFRDGLGLFLFVGLIAGIAAIAQIVVLCVWTFRMARNHQKLGRQGMGVSQPGATIAINILGGCTLGILNFFMWRELWKGSDPDCPAGDPNWKQRAVDNIVPIHLALTVAAAVAGFGSSFSVGFRFGTPNQSDADLAKELSDRLPFTLLSGALSLAAAGVFVVLVTRLAARHMRSTRETA
jgi:hypothetical protein